MKRWSFINSLLVVVMAMGAAARAAPADSETVFRQHYDNALNLYSAEQYDEAVREFQAAYAVKPRPRLLFNIGQAHRNLGNYREALRYYLQYQRMEPNPKPGLRAELERYIEQMQQLIGTAKNVVTIDNAAPANSGAPDANGGNKSDSPPPPPPPGPTPARDPNVLVTAPVAPATPVYKRPWFWGVIGGGAATILVVGLSVGLTANRSDIPVFHW